MAKNKTKATKNLSLISAKKEIEKTYGEIKKVTFGDIEVLVEPKLRPTKRNQVCADFIKVWTDALDNKQLKASGDEFIAIGTALIFKQFTSIETDANTYEELKEMIAILQDREYFNDIMSAFDEEDIAKQFTELTNTIKLLNSQLNIELEKLAKSRESDESESSEVSGE